MRGTMKTKWMQTLSTQFERACQRYPGERLMLLLDIDGTILDMRYMILAVMQAYDRASKGCRSMTYLCMRTR